MELITGITGAAAQPDVEVRPEPDPAELELQPVESATVEPVETKPEPNLEERSYTLVGRAMRFLMTTFSPGAWQNIIQKMAEQLPAKIALVPSDSSWEHETLHQQFVEDLLDQGFTDAGTFRAEAMNANLHLLVNETYDIRAVLYEHEHSGVVLDLVTLYGDGTGVTYVNREDPGHASSPLHPNVYLGHDVHVFDLLDTCLRERPKKARLPETPATAPRLMELEYEFGAKRMRGESVNPIEMADAYLEVIEQFGGPSETEESVPSAEVEAAAEEPAAPTAPAVHWTGRHAPVLPPLHEAIGLATAEHKPANSKAARANNSK
jgi:hypothetical protein